MLYNFANVAIFILIVHNKKMLHVQKHSYLCCTTKSLINFKNQKIRLSKK